MKFLRNELYLAGRDDTMNNPVIDTYKSFRFGYSPTKNSLDYILNQFQIDRSSRERYHGALTDARLLSQVYQPVVAAEKQALANPSKELQFALHLNAQIEKAGLPYDYLYVAKTADAITFMQSSNYMRGTEIFKYNPREKELPLEAVNMIVKNAEAIIDAKQRFSEMVVLANRKLAPQGIRVEARNPSWQLRTREDGTKDIAGGELKVDLFSDQHGKRSYSYDMGASDLERHLGEMSRASSPRLAGIGPELAGRFITDSGKARESEKGTSFGF